ncbi:MAG: glycosyltransferase family 4 protein [Geitlerinemataceae cyanobacterium]
MRNRQTIVVRPKLHPLLVDRNTVLICSEFKGYFAMRITFVMASASFRGGTRVIATYADLLQKRGHEVFVVSMPRTFPNWRKRFKSLIKDRRWYSRSEFRGSYFDTVDVPHQILDRRRPIVDADVPDADVVVATWWETADWVANLSPSKGAKAYLIQHHEIHDSQPKARVEDSYRMPLHKITIAQWLVDLMQSQYGDRHVSLVPNSVDLQLFNAPPRRRQTCPTVGLMYSPLNWKGCDISLKAFSLAAQKIPNLRLIAFGLDELSPDLPLPPGSEYIRRPDQKTIKDLYARCDAWLFSSRVEGFGLPILEAMACRTPVIGTPVGAAPELLTDGAGVLVPPENPEEMARAIEWVCGLSDRQWQALSTTAYARATSYTWDDATDRLETALYRAVERTANGEFLPANTGNFVPQLPFAA